jgi:hypothetical protein
VPSAILLFNPLAKRIAALLLGFRDPGERRRAMAVVDLTVLSSNNGHGVHTSALTL